MKAMAAPPGSGKSRVIWAESLSVSSAIARIGKRLTTCMDRAAALGVSRCEESPRHVAKSITQSASSKYRFIGMSAVWVCTDWPQRASCQSMSSPTHTLEACRDRPWDGSDEEIAVRARTSLTVVTCA